MTPLEMMSVLERVHKLRASRARIAVLESENHAREMANLVDVTTEETHRSARAREAAIETMSEITGPPAHIWAYASRHLEHDASKLLEHSARTLARDLHEAAIHEVTQTEATNLASQRRHHKTTELVKILQRDNSREINRKSEKTDSGNA